MPRRKRACVSNVTQPFETFDCSSSDLDAPPAQRNAANARERARMRVLSKAFCRLKTTLPWVPADTKLSKLDTLRLATSYIAHLRATLSADCDSSTDGAANRDNRPLNLSWPFTFSHNMNTLTLNEASPGNRHQTDSRSCPASSPRRICSDYCASSDYAASESYRHPQQNEFSSGDSYAPFTNTDNRCDGWE